MNYKKNIHFLLAVCLVCLFMSETAWGVEKQRSKSFSQMPSPKPLPDENNLLDENNDEGSGVDSPKPSADETRWNHAQNIKISQSDNHIDILNRIINIFEEYKRGDIGKSKDASTDQQSTFATHLSTCVPADASDAERYALTNQLQQLLKRVQGLDMETTLKSTIEKQVTERLSNPDLTHSLVLGFIGNHYTTIAVLGGAGIILAAYLGYQFFQIQTPQLIMFEYGKNWITYSSAEIKKSAPYNKAKNVTLSFVKQLELFNKKGGPSLATYI